jgi:Sigma-70, region 4
MIRFRPCGLIRLCAGSGSSSPIWAWPTAWPPASAAATGWAARTWSRRPGSGWSRRSTATTLTALRFFQDLKQKQVGCELGYSQMHISRMLRRALRQVHEQLMS